MMTLRTCDIMDHTFDNSIYYFVPYPKGLIGQNKYNIHFMITIKYKTKSS